jgi:hypothetical protein
MGRWMRQIWVVIGLTVILTFPVTVISGAGLQKHPDHMVAGAVIGGHGTGSSHGGYQSKEKVAQLTLSHRVDRVMYATSQRNHGKENR